MTVTNEGDVDATVHWHGLRLENRFDGVPEDTQAPIPVGGTFTYAVRFPDPGLHWYHPHIRDPRSPRRSRVYITNPGSWMPHCHIAEHTESGMMFSFVVTP